MEAELSDVEAVVPVVSEHIAFSRHDENPGWRLRFTEGLIVLVAMPDFSMPFNVIALSSTAVTFLYGSVFKITTMSRSHWVSEATFADKGVGLVARVKKLMFLALCGSVYMLGTMSEKEAQELLAPAPVMLTQFLLELRSKVAPFLS